MITQRDIDMFHVVAQDYLEQVRSEFQRSLTGKRQNGITRQNPSAQAQPVPAEAAGQQAVRPEDAGGDDPGAGGDLAVRGG